MISNHLLKCKTDRVVVAACSNNLISSANLPPYMTSLLILCHNKLIFYFLLQFCYMRNNSDHFAAAGKLLKNLYSLFSGMFIKRTKAFIDKHNIKINRSRTFLNLICHSSARASAAINDSPPDKVRTSLSFPVTLE